MRITFLIIFFFPFIVFGNVFNQKPQEILTFENLFNNLILAKRAELPPGYFERSKLVKNEVSERIYTVENEQCTNELFLGELYRAAVEDKIQELVVFTCEKSEEDGVNFTRLGNDLEPFDSTSLLHLDFQSLIGQGVFDLKAGEGFFLEIKSFNLEFLFQQKNHYQKSVTLLKENSEVKIKIVFTQSEYKDEFRWEFDIYETTKETNLNEVAKKQEHIRFLTISRKNPFYEDIYSHERFYNGFGIDPIIYLSNFESVTKLIDDMAKADSSLNMNLQPMQN